MECETYSFNKIIWELDTLIRSIRGRSQSVHVEYDNTTNVI